MTYPRKRRQSLTERLGYAGFRDGVSFTRSGGMEIGVEFFLPTSAEVTETAREQLSGAIRMIMLQGIPQRCRGRLIVECAPLNEMQMLRANESNLEGNDLLKLLTRTEGELLEAARRRGELVQWRYFFTVRLHARERRGARGVTYLDGELAALIRRGESVRAQLVGLLEASGFEARALSSQDAYELARRYFNPGYASAAAPLYKTHPGRVPGPARPQAPEENTLLGKLRAALSGKGTGPLSDYTAYTDTTRHQITESEIDTSAVGFLGVGDRCVGTVNLTGTGDSTFPGIAERLLRRLSGHHVYYVLDMHHLYQPDERKRLNNAARGAAVATTDTSLGTPDVGNSAVLDNISQTLYRYTSTEESVFNFGLSLVLIARTPEELDAMKEIARTEVSMMGGGKTITGTFQNIVQYVDMLAPMHAKNNEFMFRAFSQNVSHYFPLVGPFSGSTRPVAVFRNRWGGLTGLNPEDGTLNYGTLIMGSAGSGKTFFTQGWASRVGGLGANIFIVDMKRDYESFIGALGGQVIPFAPGETLRKWGPQGPEMVPVRYNAFELDDGAYEPDEEHKLFLVSFITALLRMPELDPVDRSLITAGIELVYRNAVTTRLGGQVEYTPVTLTRFVSTLRELRAVGDVSIRDNEDAQAALDRLVLSLQTFLGGTAMGRFLDGASTFDINSPYIYFDISKLADEDQTVTRQVALLLIIKQMWKRAKGDPETIKLAIIEEIGVLFNIPEAMRFVASLYKLGRAYRLWPVGVTQEIEDFRKGKGLINNTSQFLIGKVSAEEAGIISELLNLNQAAHDLILSLGGERGVYREFLAMTVKENGIHGDVIRYYPNRVEYWLYTSAPEERALRARTIEKFAGNTLQAIRALAGLNDWNSGAPPAVA